MSMSDLSEDRADVAAAGRKKKPALGSGGRFKALQASLASRPGVRDPGALAAAIGRKKFGGAKFAALSKAGRK